jgi:hypothetical protein
MFLFAFIGWINHVFIRRLFEYFEYLRRECTEYKFIEFQYVHKCKIFFIFISVMINEFLLTITETTTDYPEN